VNGIERVIVPQLARSFGIFFTVNEIRAKLFWAKIIPARGVWMEIESDAEVLYMYVLIESANSNYISFAHLGRRNE